MDKEIGEAHDDDFNHRKLRNARIGAGNKAYATFSNHASCLRQDNHVPLHVDVHENCDSGRSNRDSSRNRRQNQGNIRRILQVSKRFHSSLNFTLFLT